MAIGKRGLNGPPDRRSIPCGGVREAGDRISAASVGCNGQPIRMLGAALALQLGVTTATCAAPAHSNSYHTEAEHLLYRCLNDPRFKVSGYEAKIDNLRFEFQDDQLNEADALNGYKYKGSMTVTFPYRASAGDDTRWKMMSWPYLAYSKDGHFNLIDMQGALTRTWILYKGICDTRVFDAGFQPNP